MIPIFSRGMAAALLLSLAACAGAEKKTKYPTAEPVPGRSDVVFSPYTETEHYVEVSGMKSGTLVECPFSKKRFYVP